MAINFIQQKKKQKIIGALLVLVMIVTGVVLYQGFFTTPEDIDVDITSGILLQKKVNINFHLFENDLFERIDTPPVPIPLPGGVGRKNPFTPFVGQSNISLPLLLNNL